MTNESSPERQIENITKVLYKATTTQPATGKNIVDAVGHDGTNHLNTGIDEDTQYIYRSAASSPTTNSIAHSVGLRGDGATSNGSINSKISFFGQAIKSTTGGTNVAAGKSIVDAIGTDGTTVTDSAVSVLGAIGADNNNNAFASTNIVPNEDGSVLERLEQIQEVVNRGTGTSAAANKSLVDAIGHDGTNHLNTGVDADTQYIHRSAISSPVANTVADNLYIADGSQLRNFIAKSGGTAIATSKSLIDALGNTGDAPIPSADNATAAGSCSLQATIGRKDDSNVNVASATATLMGYAKGLTDAIGADNNNNAFASTNVAANRDGSVLERLEDIRTQQTHDATTGTHSQTNAGGTGVQTVVTNTTVIGKFQFFADLSNLTQTTTIRIQRRIDGTNYQTMQEVVWTTAMVDGFYSDMFFTRNGFRITLQSSVAEAADRDVPYEILVEDGQ